MNMLKGQTARLSLDEESRNRHRLFPNAKLALLSDETLVK